MNTLISPAIFQVFGLANTDLLWVIPSFITLQAYNKEEEKKETRKTTECTSRSTTDCEEVDCFESEESKSTWNQNPNLDWYQKLTQSSNLKNNVKIRGVVSHQLE